MGVSDESAILSKWLVREGERIRKGQPVFSLETDKATFQCEAESDGILVRILTGEGEEAAVGSPVGIVTDAEETVGKSELAAILNELGVPGKDERTHIHVEAGTCDSHMEDGEQAKSIVPVQKAQSPARRISPRARRTADKQGLDIHSIRSGSGPAERIIERDVLNTLRSKAAGGYAAQQWKGIYPGRPLTQDDRVNARKLAEDKAGRTGFVSRLVDVRDILLKCNMGNGLAPGVAICHELAKTLAGNPGLNARRHGDRIYEYSTVHLRMNAETSAGVLKPVVRCAESYTPGELAALMRNAAERCRNFNSKPHEFQDGTFTVADLSGYGIDFFTPELTSPELCALGIGAVRTQTRTNKRGENETCRAIRLTLVYDLAAIDAFRAARFLDDLAARLEPGEIRQRNDIKTIQ